MKKILFTIAISLAIVTTSYSQNGIKTNAGGDDISIRFDNRKKKGYYNITHINMLMGNRMTVSAINYYPHYSLSSLYYPYSSTSAYYDVKTKLRIAPSITMTQGYMFNEHWAAGIGVGFEIFNYNVFPLFADIRYTLWDNKISPFFSFKTGYAFNLSKIKHHDDGIALNFYPYYVYNADVKNSGGLMVHPEIGVKVPLSEKADILFTVAYRYQALKTEVSSEYISDNIELWKHTEKLYNLSFGLAIMFR